MRRLARVVATALLPAILPLLAPAAWRRTPRFPPADSSISTDLDLPGGDLATLLDTTIEACERACLANDRCTAFTFNTRNGSCFPKAGPGAPRSTPVPMSATVLPTDPVVLANAAQRRAELTFLGDLDLQQATAAGRDARPSAARPGS